MKKIDLGQTITILANVGVLVGIVLLVYELSQNRQMMQAQTRNALNEGLIDVLSTLGAPEKVDLVTRSANGEELTQSEESQLRYIYDTRFRYYENVHYQYRKGLFEEEEFLAQKEIWRRILENRIYAEHWCDVRETYSPEFAIEMDGLLTRVGCD